MIFKSDTDLQQNSEHAVSSKTLVLMVIANVLPLLGVVLWQWDVFTVLFLYWLENAIIGIFHIVKLLTCSSKSKDKVIKSVFFTVHYGAFATGHGYLLFDIFNIPTAQGGFLSIWQSGYEYLQSIDGKLLLPVAAMIAYQAFDVQQFLLKERAKTSRDLMMEPYSRVVVIHVALLFGAIFAQKFDNPMLVLIGLIGFKIFMDYQNLKKKNKLKSQSNPLK
ncbi:MAG: hypothetical protein HWD86_09705 [Kangiellaceae bacterium]|nr:hypothetical protein [Kangiellaceae bacterium]